jgi:BirA family biotin operon repressor/biotin-[acetyl-CoA-carboxylase] ligase
VRLRVHHHDRVDSTSERAFASLAEGTALHGDVHVAREQTSGRGRRGARWHSAAGEGLYLSAVLLPPAQGPLGLAPVAQSVAQSVASSVAPSLAGALAVRAALSELGLGPDRGLELKWPNDLLVRGAKVSGVLAEARGLDPARPHCVLGLGINVAQQSFPAELVAERPVTSLALEGLALTTAEVLAALLPPLESRIERCSQAPEELAREYLEATGLRGMRVRVRTGSDERTGRLVGLPLAGGSELDPDGPDPVEPGPGRARTLRIALGHVQALLRAGP